MFTCNNLFLSVCDYLVSHVLILFITPLRRELSIVFLAVSPRIFKCTDLNYTYAGLIVVDKLAPN